MMHDRLSFRPSPEPLPDFPLVREEAGRQALVFHTLRFHAIALSAPVADREFDARILPL
jgi:hypothetical protein